ncbi:MAG: N-6 DNA methylase [Leptospiraceae bacterium]|nr:N-6 DNA methylase [Leptospiraceae bacterium]
MSSHLSLLKEANILLPGKFAIPDVSYEYLESFFQSCLQQEEDFSVFSTQAFSFLYENSLINLQKRKEGGIYYTPDSVAETLLERIPLEEISSEEPVVFDPTCGCGIFLLSILKVLKRFPGTGKIQILGNEIDPFALRIASLCLLLEKSSLDFSYDFIEENAGADTFSSQFQYRFNKQPDLIIGNLPFRRKGRNQADESSRILKQLCLLLKENGLMGIILPESFITRIEKEEQKLRDEILQNFCIYETFRIPKEVFNQGNMPAMAWIMKKRKLSKPFFCYFEGLFFESSQTVRLLSYERNKKKVSFFHPVFQKMETSSLKVKDLFFIEPGLQPAHPLVIQKKHTNSSPEFYLWTGGIKGIQPFTDIQKTKYSFFEMKDENILKRAQRRNLRSYLNTYRVMLLVPSNTAKRIRACLVRHKEGSFRVAPYYAFNAIFPKNVEDTDSAYLLWLLFNHPLASVYLTELKKTVWTSINSYRDFPYPQSWIEPSLKKTIAEKVKKLFEIQKNTGLKDRDIIFLNLVKELDLFVYESYALQEEDIRSIECMYGNELRPGLKEFGETWKLFPSKQSPEAESSCLKAGMFFQTLSINYNKLKVEISLFCPQLGQKTILLDIHPSMPGWVLQAGASGKIISKTSLFSNTLTSLDSKKNRLVFLAHEIN